MFEISAFNNITVTRGDTVSIELALTKDDETYTPSDSDVISFHVATTFFGDSGYNLLISKTIDNDTLLLELDSDDTSIDVGTYLYDLEIVYEDDTVDTFMQGYFTITGEVA